MINPNYNSDTNLNDKSNEAIRNENPNESDRYMNLVENEIKQYGHNLNDSLFISSIIKILDSLSSPNSFNKTLFTHIIEFSKFDQNKPIKLYDFFHAYFTVYNTMKSNRDKLAYDNIETKRQIDTLKGSLEEVKRTEIVKNDGLTSNSSLQIIFKSHKSKSDINTNTISKIKSISINFGILPPITFSINDTYIKKSIAINNMAQLDFPLIVTITTDAESKNVDTVNVKDLLDSPVTRDYEFFEISYLWINSLVSFMNKKIALFEYDVKESTDNICILNTSINQMEMIFKSYFSQIPRSQYSNIIGGTVGNEMEVSDKIENLVLKTFGKELITKWDSILFFLNKILFISVLIEIYARCDIPTFLFCAIVFSIEQFIFAKTKLYYLLIFLLSTIAWDVFYLMISASLWNVQLTLDTPSIGILLKKTAIALAIINIVIKAIMSFALWKMALETKLLMINNQHREQLIQSQIENDFVKKNYRRRINVNTKNVTPLRDFGNDFLN